MTDSGACATSLRAQSEDALGKLAQDLLENPFVNGAISRAFEAREQAVQAQEAAMGALNIPSAADIERLTRRLRSVSQRLEGIEDGVDRLDQRLEASTAGADAAPTSALARDRGPARQADRRARLAGLRARRPPGPPPREQERLEVDEAPRRRRSRRPSGARGAQEGSLLARGAASAASPSAQLRGVQRLVADARRRVGDAVGDDAARSPRRRRAARATVNSVAASISTATAPAATQRAERAGSGS